MEARPCELWPCEIKILLSKHQLKEDTILLWVIVNWYLLLVPFNISSLEIFYYFKTGFHEFWFIYRKCWKVQEADTRICLLTILSIVWNLIVENFVPHRRCCAYSKKDTVKWYQCIVRDLRQNYSKEWLESNSLNTAIYKLKKSDLQEHLKQLLDELPNTTWFLSSKDVFEALNTQFNLKSLMFQPWLFHRRTIVNTSQHHPNSIIQNWLKSSKRSKNKKKK